MAWGFSNTGGGVGLKSSDALLRVIAPAGSTVTITKGAISKIDAGHENASDHTLYDYYFIIHQSQFDSVNPWTVTATLGGDSASDTVIIDSADEYDVILQYWNGELYDSGNEYTSATGGWSVKVNHDATLTKNVSNLYFSSTNRDNPSVIGMDNFNPALLAQFTSLNITITANTGTGTSSRTYLRIYDQADGAGTQLANKEIARNATGTFSLDITSINSGYPKIAVYYGNATITKVWLS